ncbi:13205_t:CDS:2, partial [Entrophospora sp. SA101]
GETMSYVMSDCCRKIDLRFVHKAKGLELSHSECAKVPTPAKAELLLEDNPLKVKKRANQDLSGLSKEMRTMEEKFLVYDYTKMDRKNIIINNPTKDIHKSQEPDVIAVVYIDDSKDKNINDLLTDRPISQIMITKELPNSV